MTDDAMPIEPEIEEPELEESQVESDQNDAGPRGRLTLVRGGAETDTTFEFGSPAIVGRFDPAVGPIDVDLGPLEEHIYISRKHARLECEDGAWKVVDLGSSNGTFVLCGDFERVEDADLEDGSELAFGNVRFKFSIVS